MKLFLLSDTSLVPTQGAIKHIKEEMLSPNVYRIGATPSLVARYVDEIVQMKEAINCELLVSNPQEDYVATYRDLLASAVTKRVPIKHMRREGEAGTGFCRQTEQKAFMYSKIWIEVSAEERIS